MFVSNEMKTLETWAGGEINETIKRAIAEATACNDFVEFDFNGVRVIVEKNSRPKLIYRDWYRALSGYLGENPSVGPWPKDVLSKEEIDSDNAIQAEKDRKAEVRRAEMEKQANAQKLLLQGALANAGPLELSDPESWRMFVESNRDAYGGRVVRFADEWGRLMQVRIGNGETVAQCADELGRLADDDGITGYMYGCAVQMLFRCWKHGEELRRWHNKTTQIGTEGDRANETGGVLNPAVLNIG
jgi:hypothetical protein